MLELVDSSGVGGELGASVSEPPSVGTRCSRVRQEVLTGVDGDLFVEAREMRPEPLAHGASFTRPLLSGVDGVHCEPGTTQGDACAEALTAPSQRRVRESLGDFVKGRVNRASRS